MDWTDEVRARMVREEERLRYKAANLQARGKTVMAAQELAVADDIRAALAEIERLREAAKRMLVAIDGYTIPGPSSDAYLALRAALRGGGHEAGCPCTRCALFGSNPLRVEDLLDGLPCALTGQDCVDRRHVHLTNAPRVSTEDEVREIVDGKLVKMREIGRWGYDTETGEEGKP